MSAFFFVVAFKDSSDKNASLNATVVGSTGSSQQNTDTPSPSSLPSPTPQSGSNSIYKDGVYTGSVEDAFYGNIQVQASIANGKISDVVFLQYPNDNRTSIFINSQAMPMLKSEALQVQSANVDIVSGASDSSMAFQRSLSTALSNAK